MDLQRDLPNLFSGPYIDRRTEAREAAHWLAEARADRDARYLVTSGTAPLMEGLDGTDEERPRIAWLSREHPLVQAAPEDRLVLLGWYRGARCLLLELAEGAALPVPAGARFEELRPLSNRLAADEAGVLAYARALVIWRLRHRFCGVCGAPTLPERAGHVRRCSNPRCAHEVFPRIDPAIIVLVSDGDRALLGRQASWPAGRYSTIAGFVEPGESLEDAVAREVREETGVSVERVHYHSAQPWPFPSSLMVGFHAEADARAPITVGGELEDARWFTREEIAAGVPLLPPPHAISFVLIAAWFDRGGGPTLASHRLVALDR
jgi:NAD+ diphosphatase